MAEAMLEDVQSIRKEPFVFFDYQLYPEKRTVELRSSSQAEFEGILDQVPSLRLSHRRQWGHNQYFVEEELREEITLRYEPALYDAWPMTCCRQDTFGKFVEEKNEFHEWVDSAVDDKPEMRFLTVVLNTPTDDEHFRVLEALEILTAEITTKPIRLSEINFINMRLEKICPEDHIKPYIKVITKLLKTQFDTEALSFVNVGVSLDRAFRILKAVRQGPCLDGHLKHLNVTGFFDVQDREEATMMMSSFIGEFHGLRELFMSYSDMDDRFFDAMATAQGDSLKRFGFTITDDDPDQFEISDSAWEKLLNRCSDLKVEASVKMVNHRLVIEKILKPIIPLEFLDMSLKYLGNDRTLLCESILEYVVKTFSDSIETLTVKVNTGNKLFNGNVVSLMKRMSRLKSLRLHACLPLSKCLLIAHARLENETNVHQCYLHCLCRSEQDYILMNEELRPMFDKVRKQHPNFHAYPCKFRPEFAEYQSPFQ